MDIDRNFQYYGMVVDKKNHKPWYLISPENTLSELETSEDGLSDQQAEDRLQQYGPNRIESGKETSTWKILLHQLTSPLIYILLAATAITLAIQHWTDAIVIGAVIVINTVIGFIQENRAENAINALIRLGEPKANVRRNGQEA